MPKISISDLGLIGYREAWRLQEELRIKRLQGEIGDSLLLLEHPPVYTLGKRDCSADFLSSEDDIRADGIEIVQSNRGGKITYHGPGQLVGYFIFSLRSVRMSVNGFVHAVEELCRLVLKDIGVVAHRDVTYPGLWIGDKKIAAVGLHFAHDISQHGCALNIAPDLLHYRHIAPCGIRDRGVTSVQALHGDAPSMTQVKERFAAHVDSVFRQEGRLDYNEKASEGPFDCPSGSSVMSMYSAVPALSGRVARKAS